MTTPPADLNRAIAEACGWSDICEATNRGTPPAGHVDDPCEWLPDYCGNVTDAIAAFDHFKDRFDIVIERHNGHHWKIEICEPSHETVEYDASLSLAICRALARVLKGAQ